MFYLSKCTEGENSCNAGLERQGRTGTGREERDVTVCGQGRRIAQPSSSMRDMRTRGGIGVGPFGSASFVPVAVRRLQRLGRRLRVFLWLARGPRLTNPRWGSVSGY